MARLLLEKGAPLFVASKDNFTMLMAASLSGMLSMIEQVLPLSDLNATVVSTHDTQADFTALMYDGYTALMLSCENGHEACCAALLAAGADANLADADGETALSLAEAGGHEAVCSLLKAHRI